MFSLFSRITAAAVKTVSRTTANAVKTVSRAADTAVKTFAAASGAAADAASRTTTNAVKTVSRATDTAVNAFTSELLKCLITLVSQAKAQIEEGMENFLELLPPAFSEILKQQDLMGRICNLLQLLQNQKTEREVLQAVKIIHDILTPLYDKLRKDPRFQSELCASLEGLCKKHLETIPITPQLISSLLDILKQQDLMGHISALLPLLQDQKTGSEVLQAVEIIHDILTPLYDKLRKDPRFQSELCEFLEAFCKKHLETIPITPQLISSLLDILKQQDLVDHISALLPLLQDQKTGSEVLQAVEMIHGKLTPLYDKLREDRGFQSELCKFLEALCKERLETIPITPRLISSLLDILKQQDLVDHISAFQALYKYYVVLQKQIDGQPVKNVAIIQEQAMQSLKTCYGLFTPLYKNWQADQHYQDQLCAFLPEHDREHIKNLINMLLNFDLDARSGEDFEAMLTTLVKCSVFENEQIKPYLNQFLINITIPELDKKQIPRAPVINLIKRVTPYIIQDIRNHNLIPPVNILLHYFTGKEMAGKKVNIYTLLTSIIDILETNPRYQQDTELNREIATIIAPIIPSKLQNVFTLDAQRLQFLLQNSQGRAQLRSIIQDCQGSVWRRYFVAGCKAIHLFFQLLCLRQSNKSVICTLAILLFSFMLLQCIPAIGASKLCLSVITVISSVLLITLFNNKIIAKAMDHHNRATNTILVILSSTSLSIALSLLGAPMMILLPLTLIVAVMMGINFSLDHPYIAPIIPYQVPTTVAYPIAKEATNIIEPCNDKTPMLSVGLPCAHQAS